MKEYRELHAKVMEIGNSVNSLNKSLTIHQRNLQLFMIEVFKTKNNLNPAFMEDIFSEKK